MKLEKVLDCLNSFEKNSFLKIIDSIIQSNPKNASEIDKILTDKSKDLKNIDNINIAKVFYFLEDEFSEYLKGEFIKGGIHLTQVPTTSCGRQFCGLGRA